MRREFESPHEHQIFSRRELFPAAFNVSADGQEDSDERAWPVSQKRYGEIPIRKRRDFRISSFFLAIILSYAKIKNILHWIVLT